ncbi:MAG: ChaN family lipoprotein [Deltaproteobacteria bacterium]|nr:ChaN family lipoprotein [Deltaproteobacteria bacterium]
MRLFIPLLMLAAVIWASGCAAPVKKTLITPLDMEFGEDSILSGKTGIPVSYAEMLKDLEDSQVIYIGENHTDPAHHRIQQQVIRDLTARHETAVGMEMIDHTYQPVLDKWSRGELTEQAFLEKTHWYANWRYDFDLYRGIFETVKENRIPLIGLNLPFHIPPKISVGGIDSLLPEDAGHLPKTITLTDPDHRAYVENIFNIHKLKGRENFEYFYEAQCTWEDTMAEAVAGHPGPHKMIVLVGNGHIIKKFGIPDRAFCRTRAPFRTLYLAPAGGPVDLSCGDYIWITGAGELKE